MNTFKTLLAVFVSVIVIAAPVQVQAQTRSVDDTTIDNSLREEGLDQAPGEVTVPESQMLGEKPYSGFTDENGKKLSDEEYAEYRKEQNKSIFEKQPVVTALVVIAILGGAFMLVKRKR